MKIHQTLAETVLPLNLQGLDIKIPVFLHIFAERQKGVRPVARRAAGGNDGYVFSQVCRTLRRWLDEGRPVFTISINLSRRHIPHQDFLEPFASIASQYRIPPNCWSWS